MEPSIPASPSSEPSWTPSGVPTGAPTTMVPSGLPSLSPSVPPSQLPSVFPSGHPTGLPSTFPSSEPSLEPTMAPSTQPSTWPSGSPSTFPSGSPSSFPTSLPTGAPSSPQPSVAPSVLPSVEPSAAPSSGPSTVPSVSPSAGPSLSPSASPSTNPSGRPSLAPSTSPSTIPSGRPSLAPSASPSTIPSGLPSTKPSAVPTAEPSALPSVVPSAVPSVSPTAEPSHVPSTNPSAEPSAEPSGVPSLSPTMFPSTGPSLDASAAPTSECIIEPGLLATTSPNLDYGTPIVLLSRNASTVTFSVRQTWQDIPLCSIHTDYPASYDGFVCDRRDNLKPGDVASYTASCTGGVAVVSLFVRSLQFPTSTDSPDVPDRCPPMSDEGSTIAYAFELPCGSEPEDICLPSTEPICSKLDQPALVKESFNNIEEWVFGSSLHSLQTGTILGPIGISTREMVRGFSVPRDASSVTVSFDLFVFGSVSPGDQAFARINGQYLNLFGNHDLSLPSGERSATFADISLSLESSMSDEGPTGFESVERIDGYRVSLTVPARWYESSGRLTIGFRSSWVGDSRFLGIDNLELEANCQRRLNQFHCSRTDYPCPNEGVYVCHYSTRDGYQTFCVPELDSEVVQFYPHDYCGPCHQMR